MNKNCKADKYWSLDMFEINFTWLSSWGLSNRILKLKNFLENFRKLCEKSRIIFSILINLNFSPSSTRHTTSPFPYEIRFVIKLLGPLVYRQIFKMSVSVPRVKKSMRNTSLAMLKGIVYYYVQILFNWNLKKNCVFISFFQMNDILLSKWCRH